ncbi:hypothetical protein D3C71_2019800 [compost metagenome]
MDAHEAVAEFVFQRLEGLVQEDLAVLVAQGHVLVVGDEEDHLVQGDQLDAFPGACADVTSGTAPADRSRTGQRSELYTVRSLGLLQRLRQ